LFEYHYCLDVLDEIIKYNSNCARPILVYQLTSGEIII
jgi:hypothetical protein